TIKHLKRILICFIFKIHDVRSQVTVLGVALNPGGVARDAGVDTRVLSAGALVSPRADTDDDVVVDEGTTGVSLALVATADIQPARAQHVVGDRVSELGVTVPAG
ncbi:unnamed protein product, partial [Plutella xylostella]